MEYVRAFKGVQIANITDLSILHSQASIPHAKIWKLQNKFAKSFYFRLKDLNVVSISEYTKQDIHRYFKRVNTRINVIYNGIDDFGLTITISKTVLPINTRIEPILFGGDSCPAEKI